MNKDTTTIVTGSRQTESESRYSVSAEVVDAVADARGVDPLDLDERLFDVVDPDALDALFEPGPFGSERVDGRVTFAMAGCEVVVEADGSVDASAIED